MSLSLTKACFVIAPVGDPGSAVRDRSDKVLRHIIEPAVTGVSHEPLRADHIHAAGHINDQIVICLCETPLAVADLTGLNPNVMYELAIRHAVGLPISSIASIETKLPFDIAGLRTIFFDLQDVDSVKAAALELKEQLRAHVDSPTGRFSLVPGRDLIPVRLTVEQTRSLIRLHQSSSSFKIYRVIDETVSEIEENPASFDAEHFFLAIQNALMESRRLCTCFESRKLGNLFHFYSKRYAEKELRAAVESGQRILLNPALDANTKRKRLLDYVHSVQLALDKRIEDELGPDPNPPSAP